MATALVATWVMAGCGGGPPSPAADDLVAVATDDSTCTVPVTELPAGARTFRITNSGAKVTEFYVYGPGNRIVGEVENVAPGLTRDLRVDLPAGTYEAVCKPGMTGDGLRYPLTVTGTTTSAPADPLLEAAAGDYARYVGTQADDLLARTTAWVATIKAGDLEGARAGFAATRAPYERIEPVAESFADLDPRIDARDTDLASGETWTGFHRLEKDLWAGRKPDPAVAEQLLADVTALHQQMGRPAFTALDLANGAKTLLDEMASKKVTGEEDHFSHTDLSDFAANLDGCKAAVAALRPALDRREPALVDKCAVAVDALLAGHRTASGYVDYTALTPAEVQALSDALNGLAEPVSRIAAAVSN